MDEQKIENNFSNEKCIRDTQNAVLNCIEYIKSHGDTVIRMVRSIMETSWFL